MPQNQKLQFQKAEIKKGEFQKTEKANYQNFVYYDHEQLIEVEKPKS